MFSGFFTWDAKFWKTIVPLITKPGKVSDDFINGKRFRYANPFQFYLSISILFFLMLGLNMKFEEYKDIATDVNSQRGKIINFSTDEKLDPENIDSIKAVSKREVDKTLRSFGVDSIAREKVKKNIDKANEKDLNVASLDRGSSKITKMFTFYGKNKTTPIKVALDSLKIENTFWNRFLYRKMSVANDFKEDATKANQEFSKELISYASISIFLFLPIFSLFHKLLYIRRKFTYVEHLIFVFHTQTVFFILLSIFLIVNFWISNESVLSVFGLLFLIYLILAMKKFYKQGWFKTLFKLFILSQIYLFMASIGFVMVALIAFALY